MKFSSFTFDICGYGIGRWIYILCVENCKWHAAWLPVTKEGKEREIEYTVVEQPNYESEREWLRFDCSLQQPDCKMPYGCLTTGSCNIVYLVPLRYELFKYWISHMSLNCSISSQISLKKKKKLFFTNKLLNFPL